MQPSPRPLGDLVWGGSRPAPPGSVWGCPLAPPCETPGLPGCSGQGVALGVGSVLLLLVQQAPGAAMTRATVHHWQKMRGAAVSEDQLVSSKARRSSCGCQPGHHSRKSRRWLLPPTSGTTVLVIAIPWGDVRPSARQEERLRPGLTQVGIQGPGQQAGAGSLGRPPAQGQGRNPGILCIPVPLFTGQESPAVWCGAGTRVPRGLHCVHKDGHSEA